MISSPVAAGAVLSRRALPMGSRKSARPPSSSAQFQHAGTVPVAPAQSIIGLPAASLHCPRGLSCVTSGAVSLTVDGLRPSNPTSEAGSCHRLTPCQAGLCCPASETEPVGVL